MVGVYDDQINVEVRRLYSPLRNEAKPLPAAKADLGLLFYFHDGKKLTLRYFHRLLTVSNWCAQSCDLFSWRRKACRKVLGGIRYDQL